MNTPETDAEEKYVYGHIERKWVTSDFARKLERERDQLQKVCDELAAELKYGPIAGCDPKALQLYNQLPHVKK